MQRFGFVWLPFSLGLNVPLCCGWHTNMAEVLLPLSIFHKVGGTFLGLKLMCIFNPFSNLKSSLHWLYWLGLKAPLLLWLTHKRGGSLAGRKKVRSSKLGTGFCHQALEIISVTEKGKGVLFVFIFLSKKSHQSPCKTVSINSYRDSEDEWLSHQSLCWYEEEEKIMVKLTLFPHEIFFQLDRWLHLPFVWMEGPIIFHYLPSLPDYKLSTTS